jgi:hypothetical protein
MSSFGHGIFETVNSGLLSQIALTTLGPGTVALK